MVFEYLAVTDVFCFLPHLAPFVASKQVIFPLWGIKNKTRSLRKCWRSSKDHYSSRKWINCFHRKRKGSSCLPSLYLSLSLPSFLSASLVLFPLSLSFSLHNKEYSNIIHWWIFQCRKGMKEDSTKCWVLNTSHLIQRLKLIARDSAGVAYEPRVFEQEETEY